MSFIIGLLIGAVLGFAGGFLVFRKHQDKLNKIENEAKTIKERLQ